MTIVSPIGRTARFGNQNDSTVVLFPLEQRTDHYEALRHMNRSPETPRPVNVQHFILDWIHGLQKNQSKGFVQGKALLNRLSTLPTITRANMGLPELGAALETLHKRGLIEAEQTPRASLVQQTKLRRQGIFKRVMLPLLMPFGDPLGIRSQKTHLTWDWQKIRVTSQGQKLLERLNNPPPTMPTFA